MIVVAAVPLRMVRRCDGGSEEIPALVVAATVMVVAVAAVASRLRW